MVPPGDVPVEDANSQGKAWAPEVLSQWWELELSLTRAWNKKYNYGGSQRDLRRCENQEV